MNRRVGGRVRALDGFDELLFAVDRPQAMYDRRAVTVKNVPSSRGTPAGGRRRKLGRWPAPQPEYGSEPIVPFTLANLDQMPQPHGFLVSCLLLKKPPAHRAG